MQGDNPASPSATETAPQPGLPPVRPPSARFILELFLVPGLIVAFIVCAWLFVNWLTGGGQRSPEALLNELDSSNPEVRWRAANDLAQILKRDDRWAANSDFALKLTDRLDLTLKQTVEPEKAFLDKLKRQSEAQTDSERSKNEAQADSERSKLRRDRDYIQYLTGCLGNFMVPVALPLLCQIAEQDSGIESSVLTLRRRQAIFSLATLGQNATRFDKLHPVEKAAILNALEKARQEPKQRPWAEAALKVLEARERGRDEAPGVAQALEKCAESKDPVLREYVAFAANFWQGNETEREKIDTILIGLTDDTGQGAELDPKAQVKEEAGLTIRINALIALCRRGSPLLEEKHFKQIKGLLDENDLGKRLRLVEKSGKEEPNEAKVVMTILQTLQAIAKLHEVSPKRELNILVPAIESLQSNSNVSIQKQARETLEELRK